MKSIFKSVLGMAAMAGVAALAASAATAAGISVGIGVPAVVIAPTPGYVAYDDQYYYDPIYISGAWYHGPARWRMWHGERMFFVNGRWHRNEWREGRMPASIVFHNGGSFSDGRYGGFQGAERINARFHVKSEDMREDSREMQNDKDGMRDERSDMREDRQDRHDGMNDAGHEDGTR